MTTETAKKVARNVSVKGVSEWGGLANRFATAINKPVLDALQTCCRQCPIKNTLVGCIEEDCPIGDFRKALDLMPSRVSRGMRTICANK